MKILNFYWEITTIVFNCVFLIVINNIKSIMIPRKVKSIINIILIVVFSSTIKIVIDYFRFTIDFNIHEYTQLARIWFNIERAPNTIE